MRKWAGLGVHMGDRQGHAAINNKQNGPGHVNNLNPVHLRPIKFEIRIYTDLIETFQGSKVLRGLH
jgi:hypothetical protein